MSEWRKHFKVHPSADAIPMMDDDGIAELGKDIKANGLRTSITVDKDGVLLDGRNRLEAMERVGIDLCDWQIRTYPGHAVSYILSANIHRRHLTKQQKADSIVAVIRAAEKPPQLEAVSKGGRGNVNPVKAKAIDEGKKADISKATMERALAKAEGKTPKPKAKPIIIEGLAVEVQGEQPSKRVRRRDVEIGRDKFITGFVPTIDGIGMVSEPDDAVLGMLTPKEIAETVETFETAWRS